MFFGVLTLGIVIGAGGIIFLGAHRVVPSAADNFNACLKIGMLEHNADALAKCAKLILPQTDSWAKPTVAQIAGGSCSAQDSPQVRLLAQDPQTHYYSGRIWAISGCRDEKGMPFIYRGCADATWDPTGTSYTLKVLWQEKQSLPIQGENHRGKGEGCLSGY